MFDFNLHNYVCLVTKIEMCLFFFKFLVWGIIFELTNLVNTGGENHDLCTCYITYGLNDDASIFIVVGYQRLLLSAAK